MRQEQGSVPAVVFDHVVEFNDVLPLFVLLAALEGLFLKGGKRLLCLDPLKEGPDFIQHGSMLSPRSSAFRGWGRRHKRGGI